MEEKQNITVAVAGNPNVGKSTLFNALTGLKQHTGNWSGKTVGNARGRFESKENIYTLVDIPGTYSLLAHSKEEEIARNYLCFGEPETVIAVCDATCLERNLNLVLQILEIHNNVIVCVNLMDEAKRKGIEIDLEKLSKSLSVPVVSTVARNKKSLKKLVAELDKSVNKPQENVFTVKYPQVLEEAIDKIKTVLDEKLNNKLNHRWLALQLLEPDESLLNEIKNYCGFDLSLDAEITEVVNKARRNLQEEGFRDLRDTVVSAIVETAEKITDKAVNRRSGYSIKERRLDRIFTSKHTGYLIMLALLCLCLWITVTGANFVSDALSLFFAKAEEYLIMGFDYFNISKTVQRVIIEAFYRVPTWVVAVMLPPMAIFFPLFTLLEDAGYLPRVAFNLDKPFKRCQSCGKQALTMCMGFGCNAAGVTGCRIIDSPRERLLAILTNSLVPCNGRFPTIIAIISMFFVTATGVFGSVLSALMLTAVILFGILMTFAATKLLSATVLKGVPSAYTLEMPPYRKPQIGKVIVRSIFDRTLFVLGRSLLVAIPAGVVIFLMANVRVGDITLLSAVADFLDPFARFLGLDGVILIAFILGFPANEIVVPIIIMGYLSGNSLAEMPPLTEMRELFIANGWTANTALCTMIFSLLHWPCSTTVLTIKKETGSLKWTAISVMLPTVIGMMVCMLITAVFKMFN